MPQLVTSDPSQTRLLSCGVFRIHPSGPTGHGTSLHVSSEQSSGSYSDAPPFHYVWYLVLGACKHLAAHEPEARSERRVSGGPLT